MQKGRPLYIKVIDYLKKQIEDGKILPDEQVPTEHELAGLFGVSRITSKRALSELEREGLIYRIRGKGSFVQKKKKQANSMKMVALIQPFDPALGGMMETIMGATEYLSRRGYYLSIHNSERSAHRERELINELVDNNVDGIIFYPLSDKINLDLMYRLYLEKFPIVIIDKLIEDIPISHVLPDNFKGGYLAAETLIRAGHTRIAFVGLNSLGSVVSVRQRYYGYCRALYDNGISADENIVQVGLNKEVLHCNKLETESWKYVIEDLLAKGVTAIQAENDLIASQLLLACSEMGLNVPSDLSIIGFDNIRNNQVLGLPLTTIEQDFYGLGKHAAEILVETMETGVEFKHLLLPVKLIPGSTLAKRSDRNAVSEC